MKIVTTTPLAAALLLLSVFVVESFAAGEKPAELAGCYWRATIAAQGGSYGKVQCSQFKGSDCNTTVDPGAGYGAGGGPVESVLGTHKSTNNTNPRDCAEHDSAHGTPNKEVPTAGDNGFTGTPYGNPGGGYSTGTKMRYDACEDMMVGSCWADPTLGVVNQPRCVANKDQCGAGETFKEWNYLCDGKMVCPGGCKQAAGTPAKPPTQYGKCSGGNCAIDETHCASGETFSKPTATTTDCTCKDVKVGACKRTANPPGYKVRAIGSYRCVTSADSCLTGGQDSYGRPVPAMEVYVQAHDADADFNAEKCRLCLDYNIDTDVTAWPSMTCSDPFKTYMHPYAPHTHEIQMQIKLPYSKSDLETTANQDLLKGAFAGAASKPGTGSYNTGGFSVLASDVYITTMTSSPIFKDATIVDVSFKAYSTGYTAADMVARLNIAGQVNMHLKAAGKACTVQASSRRQYRGVATKAAHVGSGSTTDTAPGCALNDALNGCTPKNGATCTYTPGMMPGEICNAASLIAMKSPGVLQPVDATKQTSCASEVKPTHEVKMTVALPYTKDEFEKKYKDTFRMAVADAAAVDLTLVTVGNVTETTASRRAGSVNVDITIKASSKEDADKVSSAMTEENLNTHCANHGLAKATMVTAPTVQRAQAFGAETSSSTSVRAFWWSYMAMAAGLLVSSF